MKKTKRFILAFVFIMAFLLPTSKSFAQMMQVGEYLEYEVSYLAVKLGVIKVYTEKLENLNGIEVWKAKATMETYSGIPFVDLKASFESWIDQSISYSHRFDGNLKLSDGSWEYTKILFDYNNKKINYELWNKGKKTKSDQVNTPRKWNDGLSIFFLARKYAHSKRSVNVPSFINFDTAYTHINFQNKKEAIKVEAINYPVRTVYFKGMAYWKSVYGVSGGFEGWFSDDEAGIPILAKMKLYIGSADIKLIAWKRKDWAPPKAE